MTSEVLGLKEPDHTDATRVAPLIQPDKVHGSLYTDPGIFAEELQKIWYRTWVFVGHESEVAQPGDYVRKTTRTAGRHHDPRSRRRCSPAAEPVRAPRQPGLRRCQRGNSGYLPLSLHGWTYRNTGELIGFPFLKGYGGRQTRPRPGPGPAGRVLPGLRVRQFRRRRALAGRTPGRRRGRDRPAGAAVARGRGRADRGLAAAPRPGRTGSCWPRTRPTATTRSSCTARSSE